MPSTIAEGRDNAKTIPAVILSSKKDYRNLCLMALIVDGAPQFVGEYIE